jgi:thermostable 8-oxoguanine DNA glycosylase
MQLASVTVGSMAVCVELPDPDEEVIRNVRWGEVYAFPTPAYWAYQVITRRLTASSIRYKLGVTFRQELGACLLGGHGIPANVGIAAFKHLQQKGAFDGHTPSAESLTEWLSEFLTVDGRAIRYRFAKQKGRYLHEALRRLDSEPVPMDSGRALRDWLLGCPGVGYKTASWIARNWLDANDVAILDIHVLRAGIFAGFFDPALTVDRDYLALESQFLAFSDGLGVRASELDAIIWHEMMSARLVVQDIVERLPSDLRNSKVMPSKARSNKRNANTPQLPLVG